MYVITLIYQCDICRASCSSPSSVHRSSLSAIALQASRSCCSSCSSHSSWSWFSRRSSSSSQTSSTGLPFSTWQAWSSLLSSGEIPWQSRRSLGSWQTCLTCCSLRSYHSRWPCYTRWSGYAWGSVDSRRSCKSNSTRSSICSAKSWFSFC